MFDGLLWNCEVWFRGGSLQYVLYGELVSVMAKEGFGHVVDGLPQHFCLVTEYL